MLTLGIDTSTMTGGAALVGAQGLVAEFVLNIRSTHSERLLPAIETLLNDAQLALADIDAFAVATGPGSFTGLRIGMATAKGLAYATGRPLLGVTVLDALARQFAASQSIVIPLIDARRQEVYAQPFRGGQALCEPWNVPLATVLQWCQSRQEPVLFCGDGAVLYEEHIRQTLPAAILPPAEQRLLRSSAVAGLGRERLLRGEQHDVMSLVPFYMRKSEAEIQWDAKT